MEFKVKWTTADLISHDVTGLEAKKITISNDAYAIGENLFELLNKIEHLRQTLIK